MKNAVYRVAMTGSLVLASASPLLAQASQAMQRPRVGVGAVRSVPEIDASAGLLAIAAVLAITAFAWERRRRSV